MADIRSFFTPRNSSSRKSAKQAVEPRQSKSPKITPLEKEEEEDNNNELPKAPKKKTKSTEQQKEANGEKGKQEKKKKRMTIESDSEEEPLPLKLRKGKEDKKNSKKTSDENHDEDVVFVSETPKKVEKSKAGKRKPSERLKQKEASKPTPQKVLKPTTAADFFSTKVVQQSSMSTKRKKTEPSPLKSNSTEDVALLADSRDEFDNTEVETNVKDPPMKKMKMQAEKLSPEKSLRRSPRKIHVEKLSLDKSLRTSPRKNKIHTEEHSPRKDVRRSPRKLFIASSDKSDEVIEPTPPPCKKASKNSSLASKLSAKVKDSEVSDKPKQKNKNEDGMADTESKMKDAVKGYLQKAKEVGEKKNEKTETVKTPQREQKKPPQHASTTPSTATPDNNRLQPNTPGSNSTPAEKKKNNYYAYKNRDGPSALGSKQLPEGAENCLAGLTFVITGILESFEREEIVDCVQRYGGKVTGNVSGKTSYLIVGRDGGQSKLDKAAKCKTKQMNEDEFIELVKTRPGKTTGYPPKGRKASISSNDEVHIPLNQSKKVNKSKSSTPDITPVVIEDSQGSSGSSQTISDLSQSQQFCQRKQDLQNFTPSLKTTQSPSSQNTQSPGAASESSNTGGGGSSLLWVDKYKPMGMKQIVGQQGDKSNAKKLKKWLLQWKENNVPGKSKPNYYAGKEDGSIFKAALLSGPPGVGKTTTATLVCQEAGFSYIEMNASDTRGKKALETVIKECLSNVTVSGMIRGEHNDGKDHVLLMDEVDGMAGNEDRGGMQELIQLIKKSKIPIICMCNDRNHAKVRSLANHCFDLRFYKPRVEQIKGFALSIAAKEGLKIPPQAMEQIVIGTNQDIRQVLHNLQMWTSTTNSINYDDAKEKAKNAHKNIKLGPFDVVKQLFTHNDASKLNIKEKTDLFFMDYSFIPLFIQENYLAVNPSQGRGNPRTTLELISSTADAIADGNLVESLIRSDQNWSLLPLQGLFSAVIPSMKMSGYLGQRIDFPQWLGKNSTRNKYDRILQELKTHMAMSCNCIKSDINMDYLAVMKQRLSKPLVDSSLDANTAAKEVISLMDDYNLTREDWDSIMDIGKWGNETDLTNKIPSKVKSAFTRLYNKETHKTPYAVHQAAKKTKGKAAASEEVLLGDDEETIDDEENNADDDITKDAMIKVKKEPAAGSSGKNKSASKKPTSKGKASGNGRAKK